MPSRRLPSPRLVTLVPACSNSEPSAHVYALAASTRGAARWRTVDQPGASTATEETAHGVDAPAGDVLAKRPDWQAWRRVWGRGRHGPARGL